MSDGSQLPMSRKKRKVIDEEEEDDDHQAELDALKEKDPEFFKFLKDNDRGLLTFDGKDDDEEDEDEDEDEEEAEEEEEAVSPPPTKTRVFGAKELAALQKGKVVKEKKRRKVAGLVRLACRVEDDSAGMTIVDPAVRSSGLAWGCEVLGRSASNVEAKVAVKALTSAIASTTQGTALPLLAARGLRHLTRGFRDPKMVDKCGGRLVRCLVDAWAGAPVLDFEEDEQQDENVRKLQVEAYLRLRELVEVRTNEAFVEVILRKAYSSFAAKTAVQSKTNAAKNRRRAPAVSFVAAGVADLYATAKGETAYRVAFGYVRQLALKVRNAIADPKQKAHEVLDWRFVHAVRVWCAVATSQNDHLTPLVFPLCQTLFGAIHVAKKQATFAPFQLHCVRGLHALAAKQRLYVPTTGPLISLVDAFLVGGGGTAAGKKKQSRTIVEAASNLDFVVALSEKDLSDRVVRDEIIKDACDLLGDWIDLGKYSPGFPELAVVPVLDLKHSLSGKKVGSTARAVVSATITAFQSTAAEADRLRGSLLAGKTPRDLLNVVEPLKPSNVPDAGTRLTQRRKDRSTRKAKLLALATKPRTSSSEEGTTTQDNKKKKIDDVPVPLVDDDDANNKGKHSESEVDDVITSLNIDDF